MLQAIVHSAQIQLTRFGKLTIGDVPRVVGTLTTIEALRSFGERYRDQCDVAEIRLDVIGEETEWQEAARHIQQGGTPTLLTLRTVAEGGRSKLSPMQAVALAQGAWDAISAIDVEHERPDAPAAAEVAQRNGKAVVASFHDFGGTPEPARLAGIIATASAYADVVKISTFVNSPDDIGVLEGLLRRERSKPLCVIGMGPLGARTRTDFPVLGSCLTYGYLDAPAAPGQLSAPALLQHLRCRGN